MLVKFTLQSNRLFYQHCFNIYKFSSEVRSTLPFAFPLSSTLEWIIIYCKSTVYSVAQNTYKCVQFVSEMTICPTNAPRPKTYNTISAFVCCKSDILIFTPEIYIGKINHMNKCWKTNKFFVTFSFYVVRVLCLILFFFL